MDHALLDRSVSTSTVPAQSPTDHDDDSQFTSSDLADTPPVFGLVRVRAWRVETGVAPARVRRLKLGTLGRAGVVPVSYVCWFALAGVAWVSCVGRRCRVGGGACAARLWRNGSRWQQRLFCLEDADS